MKYRYKKKAATHIGMMISFAVFIIFLAFLFSAIAPSLELKQDKKGTLNLLEKKLYLEFSDNITTILLKANITNVALQNGTIVRGILNSSLNYSVMNKDGEILNATREGDDLKIECEDDEFIIIYVSKYLNSSPVTEKTNFSVTTPSSIRNEKKILKKKIIEIINEFNSNYTLFKDSLGIDLEDNFNFEFSFDNDDILIANNPNDAKNVYAKEVFVNYIDEFGNFKKGKLNLRVW